MIEIEDDSTETVDGEKREGQPSIRPHDQRPPDPKHPRRRRTRRDDGRSRGPEPRLPNKHVLNPPIVTIFGGGIAGLTAAHELVERGFYVQVIEQTTDPYRPGCPLVGGMAANQPARVRANLEDIHEELITVSAKHPDQNTRLVAEWLLKMFAFNRSRWIQSERPEDLDLFVRPVSEGVAISDSKTFAQLSTARTRYKNRWIWDLVVRSVEIGAMRYEALANQEPHQGEKIELDKAINAYREFVACETPLELALAIRDRQQKEDDNVPHLKDIRDNADLVKNAFQREFLCFRLVPPPGSDAATIAMLQEWQQAIAASDLAGCLIGHEANAGANAARQYLPADDVDANGIVQDVVDDIDRIATGPTVVPPLGFKGPWLTIDVIEQRLPGEHGFRFFPTFYRHVEDTMKRIPLSPRDPVNGRTVLDNLSPTVFQGLGFSAADLQEMVKEGAEQAPRADEEWDGCDRKRNATGASVVTLFRKRPSSIEGFRDRTDRFVQRLGGNERDALFMFTRLIRFMTSSSERRKAEYEKMSWSRFLKITELKDGKEQEVANAKLSKPMRHQIRSAAQALLAFSADEADARSYGNVAVQMLLDELEDGTRVDRTLNGPTSDAWLEPWRRYLAQQGVRFFQGTLDRLERVGDELVPRFRPSTADRSDENGRRPLEHGEGPPGHQPDFYVLALNVERAYDLILSATENEGEAKLVLDEKASPDFCSLVTFGNEIGIQRPAKPAAAPAKEKDALKDMTGLQYFFDAKTSIGRGHMYFPYTKWGLSSISQSEFWNLRGSFADGYADVLSVGICDTGRFDGAADRSRDEKVKPDTTFWNIMKRAGASELDNGQEPDPGDTDLRRLKVAEHVWDELAKRIDPNDELAQPQYFHVDQNVRPWENTSKFLASLYSVNAPRPGYNSKEPGCVGKGEVKYSLNCGRWVMCGTFMGTHTRITTMEAANESARHAVKAILRTVELRDEDVRKANEWRRNDRKIGAHGYLDREKRDKTVWIESYQNKKYNGAYVGRRFDPPDIFNLEELELDDLDFFRRVDRRLLAMGLPHLFDILDFDRKVDHALDTMEIYKGGKPLRELLGLIVANLDTTLLKALGPGYNERIDNRAKSASASFPLLQAALPDPPFADMKGLLGRFNKILDALAGN